MRIIALVIGNNNYPDPDKLENAVNDAKSMEDVFCRLGYTVLSGYNCDNQTYGELLTSFEQGLPQYDASIFFYAGHGFQEEGENYLPSIECQVSQANKHILGRYSIRLSELMEIYKKSEKKTHIAILDACRKRSQGRGGYDSFAPVDAPSGTLIAFSTSPNCAAKDSSGEGHSVYTKALLNYIGREQLTVEQLFKKVRRTVAQWTQNEQIPWEHTSLIADFCFNTGQMVASPQIPYKEDVVRDAEYSETGEIADLINEIKSCDYNRQNPAIEKMLAKKASDLDRNQQFIFGRNLLQSSSWSFSAQKFMNSLSMNLRKYRCNDGDNHVLNGILFEIYFDSHGEFRSLQLKDYFFDEVMALRKHPDYAKSFEFIRTILKQYKDDVIYLIPEDDAKLDVTIVAQDKKISDVFGEERLFSIISMVLVEDKNITELVKRKYSQLSSGLLAAIASVAKAPKDAISIHSNITLQDYIDFVKNEDENIFDL